MRGMGTIDVKTNARVRDLVVLDDDIRGMPADHDATVVPEDRTKMRAKNESKYQPAPNTRIGALQRVVHGACGCRVTRQKAPPPKGKGNDPPKVAAVPYRMLFRLMTTRWLIGPWYGAGRDGLGLEESMWES